MNWAPYPSTLKVVVQFRCQPRLHPCFIWIILERPVTDWGAVVSGLSFFRSGRWFANENLECNENAVRPSWQLR